MRLEILEVNNYKSFKEAEVKFGRLTVLIGKNASGKSNLLDAIQFVHDIIEIGLSNAVSKRSYGSFSDLVFMRSPDLVVSIKMVFSCFEYNISVGPDFVGRKAKIIREEIHTSDKDYIRTDREFQLEHNPYADLLDEEVKTEEKHKEQLFVVANNTDSSFFWENNVRKTRQEIRTFYEVIKNLKVYRPLPDRIRALAQLNYTDLNEDGSGFPSILQQLDPEDLISFGRFLFEGDQQISDGTLAQLFLLTGVLGYLGSDIFVLEEPEKGIHFQRLKDFIELAKYQLEQNENKQFIFTTHCIQLLHYLEPENVIAVTRKDGISSILPPPTKSLYNKLHKEEGMHLDDFVLSSLWPDNTA